MKTTPYPERQPAQADPEVSDYEARVRAYEAQGMDRSDAQGVVDAEDMGA